MNSKSSKQESRTQDPKKDAPVLLNGRLVVGWLVPFAVNEKHTVLAMFCDITLRKQLEQGLKEANAQLKASNNRILAQHKSILESDVCFRYGGDEFLVLLPPDRCKGGRAGGPEDKTAL